MEFFFRIEIKMPLVIQGLRISLRCRREYFFKGACLLIVEDTTCTKPLKIEL